MIQKLYESVVVVLLVVLMVLTIVVTITMGIEASMDIVRLMGLLFVFGFGLPMVVSGVRRAINTRNTKDEH